MSEFINNNETRLASLIRYAIRMLDGERGAELYEEYKDVILKVTPKDVITVVDELVKTGEDIDLVKRAVNKILNTFYIPIKNFGSAMPEKNSLLFYLQAENEAMQVKMTELKKTIKLVFSQKDGHKALIKYKETLLTKAY